MPAELAWTRLCLTGAERTLEALQARLAIPADLYELRLDLLERLDQSVFTLISSLGERALVACRPVEELGAFQGTPAERLELLERAARAGAGWVDLELALVERAGVPAFVRERGGATRWVLSCHADPCGRELFEGLPARMARCPWAQVGKLALRPDFQGGSLALADLRLPTPQQVLIELGPAGVWSRARPSRFTSAWSYVAGSEQARTAPGQLTVREARALRLQEHAALTPLALLGGASVRNSPGPAVYNRLFSHLGLPFQYLPLQAGSWPGRDWKALGARGASVTMPFKLEAAGLAAREGRLEPWGARTGVVNSLWRDGRGRLHGDNTDAPAVLDLLGARALRGRRVLVLGGGASARSVAVAVAHAGGLPELAARDLVRARELLGAWPVHAWDQRSAVPHQVLVNTTPLGADGRSSPWPDGAPLARVVLDLALPADAATPLVVRARREGCRVLDGHAFWLAQGRRQMARLAGVRLPSGLLAAELEAWRASSSAPLASSAGRPRRSMRPLRVPGSKSVTQRALVLAALARGESSLRGASECADSRLLAAALSQLGARVAWRGEALLVRPAVLTAPGHPLWCGNAGTVLRFLAALAVHVQGELGLAFDQRLGQRPGPGLWQALRGLGLGVEPAPVVSGGWRLTRVGPPEREVAVAADETSQFLSALLLAAPRLPTGLTVRAQGRPVSLPYVDLTVELLRRFGVECGREGDAWRVEPAELAGQALEIEGDWSLAASWRVAERLLGRRVPLAGLSATSTQGDRAIDALLAELDRPGDHLLDLRGTPDLVPPLAVAALFARGATRLTGVAHARLKESDRLGALAEQLALTGARVTASASGLDLEPGPLHGATLSPVGDHRLAMAFGVLSLRVPGLQVLDRGVVAKSYPSFWDHLAGLQ
jgi:3-phosphoshikimate 1-carboxyvinyltransferase